MTFFDLLLRDRVEAGDASVEGVAEFEVLLVRFPPRPQRRSRRGEA